MIDGSTSRDAAIPHGDLAGIEAGFVSALQQTFSVTGTTDAIEADGSWSRDRACAGSIGRYRRMPIVGVVAGWR